MRPSIFTYTEAQREALDRLVASGFCRPNSLTSQAQIDCVWQHVPVEQGGGMGLGLQHVAIANYVVKKTWPIKDKSAEMARWHQWVANHNEDVPVPYAKTDRGPGGYRRFSAENRKILQNLLSLGLCFANKREKIQVKHVWFQIPVEQLGGQGLELGLEQVMNWVRRSCAQSENLAGGKDTSMEKWEKWISDHNHLVPPYQYPDGTWSRENHPSSTGASKQAQTLVGVGGHEGSDSPLTDLSDIDIAPPTLAVLPKVEAMSRVEISSPARKKRTRTNHKVTPAPYHLRDRGGLASGRRSYADYYTDSDNCSGETRPQERAKARGHKVAADPGVPTTSHRLQKRTSLGYAAGHGEDSSINESPNDKSKHGVPVADKPPTETHRGGSIVLQFPARVSATPCPQRAGTARGTNRVLSSAV